MKASNVIKNNFLSILSVVVIASGCATPYMANRGRDARDVFTAGVGYGIGVKARVGIVQAAIVGNQEKGGLRGGEFFADEGKGEADMFLPFPFERWCYGYSLLLAYDDRNKNVDAASFYVPLIILPAEMSMSRNWYFTQAELTAGLGGSITLGCNPGELLDFILGWFGVDIYGDDIGIIDKAKDRETHL